MVNSHVEHYVGGARGATRLRAKVRLMVEKQLGAMKVIETFECSE